MPGLMGVFASKLKQSAELFNFLTNKNEDNSPKNDPDEKWSNLYRERQRNHLYKWVDVRKGGELIEIYNAEGAPGVVRFANEKVAPMLYNDGTLLERVRLADYLKWRKAFDANLNGFEDDLRLEEEIKKNWTDHTSQWRLNKRGVDGETVIHLLLSRDDAKCTEIAKILIKLYPGLATDIYEGDEFYGQSSLHLAIVHDDYDCVSALLDAGADINRRATGRFFLPEDQKKSPSSKQTNYAGFAYYGEYPLAFAVSFGNKDIYDLLVHLGADPNAQDSFGNTVLHICVINNSLEMYSYAVRHWAKPADVNICNNAGYTALTLATILGRREIFEAMLELTKVEFWRFSDMACSAYPLTTLDTISPDGSTNWDSALMRVVSSARADHMDIVGSEVIQRLLADKWRSFGRKKMYQRFVFLIFHLLILSIAIYIRPDDATDLWGREDTVDYVRYAVEAALLISCLMFLVYQQGGEIRAQGLNGYLKTLIRAPDKIVFLFSNVFLLFCIPCRLTDQHTAEEILLVLALPGSWTYLLFFAKGYLLTGPFVVMIYKMIRGDMIRFAVISLIFLISFSQAFFFLGKDMKERQLAGWCDVALDDHEIVDYDNYGETAMTLFRMSMGGYDYEEFDCASYKPLAKFLFVIYMIIMPIMLINMLIAMMGNTYTTVISQAENAWRQQWAQLVILLERALDKKKLAKYQTAYSIKLSDDRFDSDDQSSLEIRALMVIKQTKKTRAKQRKQATASWKRLSRKIMALRKSHTTDRVREFLHNQNYLPAKLISRAPSANGVLFPLIKIISTESAKRSDQQTLSIDHVVDSTRTGQLAVDRASPPLFVHQANVDASMPKFELDQNQSAPPPKSSMDAVPNVSSPTSPVDQRNPIQYFAGIKMVAKSKGPKFERRKGSIQLEPLNAEVLPLRRHRGLPSDRLQRSPKLRKRHSEKNLGGNDASTQHQRKVATSEAALAKTGEDRRVAASVSSFLNRTTRDELPNIPQHEQTKLGVGDEETASFHEESFDKGTTHGTEASSSTTLRSKSPSPSRQKRKKGERVEKFSSHTTGNKKK